MPNPNSDHNDIAAQLELLHAKLDYVVERQRFIEDFIDEMTPVGRDVLGAATTLFADLEAKGYFSVGTELLAMADNVVQTYGPGEVHALGGNIISILDTVRNVTQPDVLAMANEATDVIHNVDEIDPIGPLGMFRATNDSDVQRGMAIAMQVLKQLGKLRGGAPAAPSRPKRPASQGAQPTRAAASSAPAAVEAAAKASCGVTPTPTPAQPVLWEGREFDPQGFLVDPSTWDEELAQKMAVALGQSLDEDHWTVLRWARSEYLENGASPNVRKVARGSGVGIKRVYELFPKSPGKTAAMIAGIPKPVGCV